MPEALLPISRRPAYPLIAGTEAVDRISQANQTYELPVALVYNQEAEAPSIARRHRDAPMQAGIPEEMYFF